MNEGIKYNVNTIIDNKDKTNSDIKKAFNIKLLKLILTLEKGEKYSNCQV